MLYGRANEPSPDEDARECDARANHPQSGATVTDCEDSRRRGPAPRSNRAMTFTTPDSSDACWARHSPTRRGRRAAVRETPLPAPWRRPDPNDPDARSSQLLLFFARCCDGDHKT